MHCGTETLPASALQHPTGSSGGHHSHRVMEPRGERRHRGEPGALSAVRDSSVPKGSARAGGVGRLGPDFSGWEGDRAFSFQ